MPYWSTLLGTAPPPLAPTRTYTECSTIRSTESHHHTERKASCTHDTRQHASDSDTRLVYEEGTFDLSYDQQEEGHNYDRSEVVAEDEEERHGRGPGHLLDMLPKVCVNSLYMLSCVIYIVLYSYLCDQ